MNDLIFRASSVPNLMGAKGLGVTGKKEAIKAYITQFKDRTKEIKAKYLEKGIMQEFGAIELINKNYKTNYQKNDIRITNEYITGECDLDGDGEILDAKCSWDIYTFYEAMVEDGKNYEYQLRAYMELYDKPKSSVIYCLMDMPDSILLKELEWAGRPYDGDLPDILAIRIIKNYIYDKENFHRFLEFAPIDKDAVQKEINKFVHIPLEDRCVRHNFQRDETKTKLMYSRIEEARQFIKTTFNHD